MSIKRMSKLVALFAALAMVLAACGGSSTAAVDGGSSDEVAQGADSGATDDHEDEADDHADDDHEDEADDDHADDDHADDDHADDDHADDDHADEYTFGEPAEAFAADRVIEVDANDDFTFGPAEITVSAGETITFVVTNTGVLPHDFTLGDEGTQDLHEEEMAEMVASGDMDVHDDANAVVVQAGETKELTWTFTETGTVLFGCHQPGHYDAGMVGSLDVSA